MRRLADACFVLACVGLLCGALAAAATGPPELRLAAAGVLLWTWCRRD